MGRLWMHRAAWLIAFAACRAPSPPPPTPEPAAPTFPRLASYLIDTHVSDAARVVMARSDVVIVDAEAGALDRRPLDAIRAAAPRGLLLAYLTSEEIPRQPAADHPLAAARLRRIAPSEWLLEPGSTLARDLSETGRELAVVNGAAFTLHRPPSPFYGADEPTYVLVGDENMRLVAIDGDTLTVERGEHAAPHPAGARAASHVVFFAGTWMLDLAANAPVVDGRSWREDLADEAAGLVAAGPWNGLFIDDCFSDIHWLNGGLLDLNGDGIADDPATVSAEWSAGFGLLIDRLRAKLGPALPIVANPGAQDCPHAGLDGILLEGWPIGMPPSYLDYATGAARYARWSPRDDHLTIANAFSPKIGFGTIQAGADEIARTDYAAMRFGLASALLADGLYTYDNGVFGHYVAWWYDEYDGAGRGLHWLGRALGGPRKSGALAWREFEHGLAVVNTGTTPAIFAAPPGFAKLRGTQDPAHNDGRPVDAPLAIVGTDAYVLVRR